jgi:hypothetical protein
MLFGIFPEAKAFFGSLFSRADKNSNGLRALASE